MRPQKFLQHLLLAFILTSQLFQTNISIATKPADQIVVLPEAGRVPFTDFIDSAKDKLIISAYTISDD